MSHAAATTDDDLLAIFTGPLAGCAGKLSWRDAPEAMPAGDLADPAIFERLIARFQTTHAGADRKAAISFWSQFYFSTLTIPTVALTFWRAEALPLGLDATRVSFCPTTGVPLVFHIGQPHDRVATGPDVMPLVAGHLAPLIAILKRHSGLSAKLFWENAGWYFIWILTEIARQRPAHGPAIRAILADPSWPPAGCGTPLAHMKDTAIRGLPPKRRICCLRYRIPGFDRCADICPLARDEG